MQRCLRKWAQSTKFTLKYNCLEGVTMFLAIFVLLIDLPKVDPKIGMQLTQKHCRLLLFKKGKSLITGRISVLNCHVS